MKILVLGATGRTGKLIVAEALSKGHTVHVLVRKVTAKLLFKSGEVMVEGVPTDMAALKKAMEGCDAVISALNISRKNDWPWSALRTPLHFISDSMRNVIELAQQMGIQRVAVVSAWGVGESRKDISGAFRWLINNSNIRYAYLEHERQERLLAKTDLDWTAVRPTGLSNFENKARIHISFDKSTPSLTISRHAVARFMVAIVEQKAYFKQSPVISQ